MHVEKAVREALSRAGVDHANSVLLFLTPDYARDPEPALRAAARAAGCTQIFGCTGSGLLTEQEWVLDSPGAAAMVFGDGVTLDPAPGDRGDHLVLSFTTPQGLSASWLDEPVKRIGAISSDVFGHGPFAVWNAAKRVTDGHVHAHLTGARWTVELGHGVRALTAPMQVVEVDGYNVRRLGHYPALNVLINSLPPSVRRMERIPLHMLMYGVTFGEPSTAIRSGRYRLDHIVSANSEDFSITLAHELRPGERLFWALRDKLTVERQMAQAIERAGARLEADPDFAILLPCLSRGPSFYDGNDQDVALLKARYPNLPFIGFYGNGEIAPLDEGSHLYQYSAVLALFRIDSRP